jgi:hypothetical protein
MRFDPRAPRATRLAGLELRNFKSVRSADVELGPLTVIAGANSTGKSSLLQAVLALTQVTRRHIDGRRFPLNDDLTRLGTFESLRHQGANQDARVLIGARFNSDERDVRMSVGPGFRAGAPLHQRLSARGLSPADVRWAVELDSPVTGQIGSAQISALEVALTSESLAASARLERTSTPTEVRSDSDQLAEGVAFTGMIRTEASETAVLDAMITSAQIDALFGRPPDPPIRVREWFQKLADTMWDNLDYDGEEPSIPHDRAIQEAAWSVPREEPASPEFILWYATLGPSDQEAVEEEVLEAFRHDQSHRSRASRREIQRLETRGATRLGGAQRACARFLADRVRYVGPLRHAPHLPFGAAPDPDLGDVGIAGEHVASVLQANRAAVRPYPVPADPSDQLPLDELSGSMAKLADVTLIEALRRWLVHFDLAEEILIKEDMPLVLGVDVVPPGLARPVTLSAVGVGVSQILPVLVQCLVAGPGALVILEQPELHLHPAAQHRLGDFLIACTMWGQNLLVESHSEHLVLRLRRRIAEDRSDQLVKQVVILFAERDGEGATTYQPIELTDTGAMVQWPEGFFDQGPDEAHQLLIAAAKKQRQQEETTHG